MTKQFVLIVTEAGKEAEVLRKLKTIPQVKEAELVYGDVDIIAKIEEEGGTKQLEAAILEIRKIEGLSKTKSYSIRKKQQES